MDSNLCNPDLINIVIMKTTYFFSISIDKQCFFIHLFKCKKNIDTTLCLVVENNYSVIVISIWKLNTQCISIVLSQCFETSSESNEIFYIFCLTYFYNIDTKGRMFI